MVPISLSLRVDSIRCLLHEERKYPRSGIHKLYFESELTGEPVKGANFAPHL